MKVTAIFDIGKTNKKCFLFDANHQVVSKEYITFKELQDEDGFPCDDLQGIEKWVKSVFLQLLTHPEYELEAVNFSAYGASFVHLDAYSKPITPLYNYLKPYPLDILASFYQKYGDAMTFARQTASPPLQMLNSGLQLYWLKYAKPEKFKHIHWSLHLPQYLSFLLTGIPISEFTSIGCHTGLWDYEKSDYHRWVYEEHIHRLLPPIVRTDTVIQQTQHGRKIKFGVGIHDSSAALIPYLKQSDAPFLLLSTGTWSIALNPFNDLALSDEDLQSDSLNFLQLNGKPVRAARLFLGNEHQLQVQKIAQHFQVHTDSIQQIPFSEQLFQQLTQSYQHHFALESIQLPRPQPFNTDLSKFPNLETAYHQLLLELVELQIEAIQRAACATHFKRIYIDGGFADNPLFVQLLIRYFKDIAIVPAPMPLGSALGAAMIGKFE